MRHNPSISSPAGSVIEIARAALRDAAIAPTIFEALDVAGDALRRLAEIARAEARHA